jgi:hypothetical protein
MFKGAYKTDFYRSVRDALHMEVDSWRLPPEELEPAIIAAVWRRVSELEPFSHNPDAFASTTKFVAHPPSAFIPVNQLAPVRTI